MTESSPSLGAGATRQLLDQLLRGRPHAFVTTDASGTVRDARGELAWFGLDAIAPGELLEEHVVALQELATEEEGALLPRIELVSGRSTDVHILHESDQTTICLLDVTDDARRELRFQERGNLLRLMLHALGVAVFEETAGGELSLVSLRPAWMQRVMPDSEDVLPRLSFLENFLVDARETWEGRAERVVSSGQWTEEDERGREWILEATAARLDDGRRLLVIQRADQRQAERQHILQEARSRTLDLDRLRSETEKKEILLHCIVHDLKGPLSSMVGSMSLVRSRPMNAERTRELLELGLEQARAQEGMIRAVLDAFSVEIDALQHFESEAATAPDLLQCVRSAERTYRPACEQSGVRLELRHEGEEHLPVVGERSRLERVLSNLLENALRNSPEHSTIRLSVQEEAGAARVCVEDGGPGVTEDDRADLFDRLRQGSSVRGAAGLGLYFCRSTLEMWGGRIGYEPREQGGARFWFRLPRAR